jgi:hypothetical protein
MSFSTFHIDRKGFVFKFLGVDIFAIFSPEHGHFFCFFTLFGTLKLNVQTAVPKRKPPLIKCFLDFKFCIHFRLNNLIYLKNIKITVPSYTYMGVSMYIVHDGGFRT